MRDFRAPTRNRLNLTIRSSPKKGSAKKIVNRKMMPQYAASCIAQLPTVGIPIDGYAAGKSGGALAQRRFDNIHIAAFAGLKPVDRKEAP